MADDDEAHCTYNPRHSRRALETDRERRQGYCAECAAAIAAEPHIAEANARQVARQAAKDQFMAAHSREASPDMWDGFAFNAAGEAAWLASEQTGQEVS